MKTDDAVSYYGSRAALAAALSMSKSAVSQWGDVVPIGTAALIASMTHGAVPLGLDDYPRWGKRQKS